MQQRQCSGTQYFEIVRMRSNGQHRSLIVGVHLVHFGFDGFESLSVVIELYIGVIREDGYRD